jgi:hypothetical protein
LMLGSDHFLQRTTIERLTPELAASQLALAEDNLIHAEYEK